MINTNKNLLPHSAVVHLRHLYRARLSMEITLAYPGDHVALFVFVRISRVSANEILK